LVRHHARDEIVLCPPFVAIPEVVEASAGSGIGIGGQGLFLGQQGAFSGAGSAPLPRDAGGSHVLRGPSEGRQVFRETDATGNPKLHAALSGGLKPIVCVGEVLEEREAGLTEQVLRRQSSIAFREISAELAHPIVVAYEPVWAIGTGKTATPELAAEAHAVIRAEAAKAFGSPAAAAMRILYGGSVKPDNASALMAQSEIDGSLVGGASLDPKSFTSIVKY